MLEKLNVSKSPGPGGLRPRILCETRSKITTTLKLIFDASLKLKELPRDWVNANISAVYKKGKKSKLCNYRPISLTSILCKIIEQFIRNYIIQHFLHNDLYSKNQFAFLKGRSTIYELYFATAGSQQSNTQKRNTDRYKRKKLRHNTKVLEIKKKQRYQKHLMTNSYL